MGHRTLATNPARASNWEFKMSQGRPVECTAKFMGTGARAEARDMHAYFLKMPEGPPAANHIICDTFSDTDATLTVSDPLLATAIKFWIDSYPGLGSSARYTISEAPLEQVHPEKKASGRKWTGTLRNGGKKKKFPDHTGDDTPDKGGRCA